MKQTKISAAVCGLRVRALLTVLLWLIVNSQGHAAGDTKIVAWGDNTYGQTNVPAGMSDIIAISAGAYQSLALRSDGYAFAWGDNRYSQGTGLGRFEEVVGSSQFNVGLVSDGTVLRWGALNVLVDGWTNIVAIAAGDGFILGLRSDGLVSSVFSSPFSVFFGQADVPPGLTDVVGIAAGERHSLALKSDGTVVAWGLNNYGQVDVPSELTNAVAIAAGAYHSLALKSDGTVIVWGNQYGQPDFPAQLTNVVQIAARGGHSLALKADGGLVAWGYNTKGQTNVPAALSNVVAIAAGREHSLALLNDGSLFIVRQPMNQWVYGGQSARFSVVAMGARPLSYQWQFNGANIVGATNASLALTNLGPFDEGNYRVAVSNGSETVFTSDANLTVSLSPPVILVQPVSQTVLLRTNVTFKVIASGALPLSFQWQFNGNDMEGATNPVLRLNGAQASDAGDYRVVVSDPYGSVTSSNATLTLVHTMVVAWGNGQTDVLLGLDNVVAISAGYSHGLALKNDGTLVAWGDNSAGQTNVPSGLTNVVAISGGGAHSLALRNDGTVVAWGDNTYHQLWVPASVTNAVAIAAGQYHSLALRSDGTIIGWGLNDWGQAAVPQGLINGVAIAAARYSSMVLKSDGTVVAWGSRYNYPPSVPPNGSNVVAIASGPLHSLALKLDGTVVVWGDSVFDSTDLPSRLTNTMAITAGGSHSLALTSDDIIFGWASLGNAHIVPPGLTNVIAISGGYGYSLALLNDGTPFIVRQPVNRMISNNIPAVLSVGVWGALPLSYQWQFNGSNIDGATNVSLTLTNVQLPDSGYYSLTVSNAFGTVTSSNMFLNVMDTGNVLNATNMTWRNEGDVPWFREDTTTHDRTAAMQSGAITKGQQSILQATVTGPGTLSFWWKVSSFGNSGVLRFSINGVEQERFSGESDWQQRTYYLADGIQTLQWKYARASSSIAGADAGWLDEVNYSLGPTLPTFTTTPTNQDISAGENVTFASTAFGTPPLSYQWQFNGAEIVGATNTSLTLTDVQAVNTGSYSVVVSDGYGAASSTATLTVNPVLPTIVTQPMSQWLPFNNTATFRVIAKGSEPIGFQWQFNGTNIDGATNSALTLTSLRAGDSGDYQVIVSNAYSTVISSNATLRVTPSVVLAWGANFSRQTNVPPTLTNAVAIAAGVNHNLAVKQDGTVVAWGSNEYGISTIPPGLSNVVAVAGGDIHSLALKADGRVIAWGNNSYGQTNVPPGATSNIVAISAGYYHSLALKSDGTVVAWGWNASGQTNVPQGLTNVVAIASATHNLALNRDGTVVAWGSNEHGISTIPPGLSNVVAVAGGGSHSLALKADGRVIAWGNNIYGQTSVPAGATSNVVAIAGGVFHSLALKIDGTVVAWGFNGNHQTNVSPALNGVVAIGGGDYHSLALLNDGSPFIVRPGFNQAIHSGETVVLNVVALGQAPLSYQWQFNGTNIAGATNTTLTLTNVSLAGAGSYQCVVSSTLGITTSSPEILTVLRSTPRFDTSLSGLQLTDEGFGLRLNGLSGQGLVVVTASTNLVEWQPVFTNPPVTGSLQILDTSATNVSFRFYRAVEQ